MIFRSIVKIWFHENWGDSTIRNTPKLFLAHIGNLIPFDPKWPEVNFKVTIQVDILRASKWLFMMTHTCMSHPARHFRVKLKIWPHLTLGYNTCHPPIRKTYSFTWTRPNLYKVDVELWNLCWTFRFSARKFCFFRDF